MKFKQVKKWLVRMTLNVGIISIVGVVFVNYELKYMYGAYTEVVDTAQFNVISKPTTITNISILYPDGRYFIENQTVSLDKGKISSIDTINQLPKKNLIIKGQGNI